jgi:hypothetical protein
MYFSLQLSAFFACKKHLEEKWFCEACETNAVYKLYFSKDKLKCTNCNSEGDITNEFYESVEKEFKKMGIVF